MRQPFGQNFLTDLAIAQQIVDAADLASHDQVVEIGPGKGVLTERILRTAAGLTAIEIDRKLAERMQNKFSADPRFTCQAMNAMDYPLPEQPFKLIANLPYYLATAFIEKLLPNAFWETAVLMVQKEVAVRIVAERCTRQYGVLSVLCQYFARAELVLTVGPGAFFPKPKVDSAVLRFFPLRPPHPDQALFPLVKHAFQQRRKTILNSLSGALRQPKDRILPALQSAGIDPMSRPETLGIDDFVNLTNLLKKYILFQENESDKR